MLGLFIFCCWRTHAWLIYILLLACTHISLTHLFIWFHAFVGAQHMLVGLFIFIYILLLAHTSCFINILLLACTCIFLTHLFGFTLLAHNTCLAYLYFTFGIRFWRTTHVWLIYILLLACTYICLGQLCTLLFYGAQHMLGLFIFYFWRAHTHILLTHLFIWFYAFVGAQHMLGLFIFYF